MSRINDRHDRSSFAVIIVVALIAAVVFVSRANAQTFTVGDQVNLLGMPICEDEKDAMEAGTTYAEEGFRAFVNLLNAKERCGRVNSRAAVLVSIVASFTNVQTITVVRVNTLEYGVVYLLTLHEVKKASKPPDPAT